MIVRDRFKTKLDRATVANHSAVRQTGIGSVIGLLLQPQQDSPAEILYYHEYINIKS